MGLQFRAQGLGSLGLGFSGLGMSRGLGFLGYLGLRLQAVCRAWSRVLSVVLHGGQKNEQIHSVGFLLPVYG